MKTIFRNGTIITGDGRILEQTNVLVEGDRITRIADGEFPVPDRTREISLDGCVLLPGLIDCHVHLCADSSADFLATLDEESAALTTLKAASAARQILFAGVTTVRDLGGKDYIDLAIRDAIQSGIIPGPRVLASGKVICMTGGHVWPIGREADGPDEVRKAVREQIKAGVDVVKLMATGGVCSPGMEPGSAQLTEEELKAGIEEARKAGRKTAAHAHGASGIINALNAGIDSVEHGIFLTEEAAEIMARENIPLIPTLSAPDNIIKFGIEAGIPDFIVRKASETAANVTASIQMVRKAGVMVGMGTDSGSPMNKHGQNATELELMVGHGFTPMEAIMSATGNAAKILGLDKELGTVDVGKLADLIVVEGDPLEDIGILSRKESIRHVMRDGVIIDRV